MPIGMGIVNKDCNIKLFQLRPKMAYLLLRQGPQEAMQTPVVVNSRSQPIKAV